MRHLLILSALLFVSSARADNAIAEANAERAARGLRPFIEDPALTAGAIQAAEFRAARLIEGHTGNDFAALPPGTSAPAAGCAAWHPGQGFGSCCLYENWKYAGAGVAIGRDGRRYMHLFVSNQAPTQPAKPAAPPTQPPTKPPTPPPTAAPAPCFICAQPVCQSCGEESGGHQRRFGGHRGRRGCR